MFSINMHIFYRHSKFLITKILTTRLCVCDLRGLLKKKVTFQISRTTYIRFSIFFYVGTHVPSICWHDQPFCIFSLRLTDIKVIRVLVCLVIFWYRQKWIKESALNFVWQIKLSALEMLTMAFGESTSSKKMFISGTSFPRH